MSNHFKGKHGPLLIAEIGGNHEGNFEYAKRLTQLAIETNVDYIKFQIYTGNTLVSSSESPDKHNHFKRFELSKEQHRALAKMVIEAGISYTSSVWDIDAMNWIDDFMSIYKIGSGDLTAYPVLRKVAQKGKPMILSTGLATMDEVKETVKYIQSVNPAYTSPKMLALLQCTTMYPIPSTDANLSVMGSIREETGLTVGYSDHTEGLKALVYASAMGAEVLEFHFTDVREGKKFRDHKVSLVPAEVNDLISEIKIINELKGHSVKKPVQIELDHGYETSFRRGVYPLRDIKKAEILTEENLTVLRPNHGIDARDFDLLLGKKALTNLRKHQKLDWSLFE